MITHRGISVYEVECKYGFIMQISSLTGSAVSILIILVKKRKTTITEDIHFD